MLYCLTMDRGGREGVRDLHQSWTIFILLWWATMMIGLAGQGDTNNRRKIYELWGKRYFNESFIRDAPPHCGLGYLHNPFVVDKWKTIKEIWNLSYGLTSKQWMQNENLAVGYLQTIFQLGNNTFHLNFCQTINYLENLLSGLYLNGEKKLVIFQF